MDEDISGEKYNPFEATIREHEQRAAEIEKKFEDRVAESAYFGEHVRLVRIKELKQAFEASGSKYNSAEPDEVEKLLALTEKKIIQQCRCPKCHGCKLGWCKMCAILQALSLHTFRSIKSLALKTFETVF